MLRYAEMVEHGLHDRGVRVEVIRPRVFFSRFHSTAHGLGKWLGYLDKFVLFPRQLHREARRVSGRVVHICDHSNAMYSNELKGVPHVITCHDVLAIRSAHGHFQQNPTGFSGRCLQAWIRRGLAQSAQVICDSDATRRDLLKLEPALADKSFTVHNALNHPYAPMADAAAKAGLAGLPEVQDLGVAGYLFHIGGNQWYKNRAGVLRIYFAYVAQGGRLPLVMAGKPFSQELRQLLVCRPAEAKVIELGSVENATLNALYARAAALLFPSLEEGFGWPVLEALAVGCPVVCSDRASLREVGGGAVAYIDPTDENEAASRLAAALGATLSDAQHRRELGFRQAARFSNADMIAALIGHYENVCRGALKDELENLI